MKAQKLDNDTKLPDGCIQQQNFEATYTEVEIIVGNLKAWDDPITTTFTL